MPETPLGKTKIVGKGGIYYVDDTEREPRKIPRTLPEASRKRPAPVVKTHELHIYHAKDAPEKIPGYERPAEPGYTELELPESLPDTRFGLDLIRNPSYNPSDGVSSYNPLYILDPAKAPRIKPENGSINDALNPRRYRVRNRQNGQAAD